MAPNIFRPFKFGKETFHPQTFDEHSFFMNFNMQSGAAVPPHKHVHCSELFKVLKGEVTFTLNGKKIVRKAGEELLVPQLEPHSISAGKNEVEMTVTFTPCADTHHLFQILAMIEPTAPVSFKTMSKAMFVMHQLNMRQFSNPHPAMANAVIYAIINFAGKLSGWNKFVNIYRDMIQQ